jgi:hypothetical protein
VSLAVKINQNAGRIQFQRDNPGKKETESYFSVDGVLCCNCHKLKTLFNYYQLVFILDYIFLIVV